MELTFYGELGLIEFTLPFRIREGDTGAVETLLTRKITLLRQEAKGIYTHLKSLDGIIDSTKPGSDIREQTEFQKNQLTLHLIGFQNYLEDEIKKADDIRNYLRAA